MSFQVPAVVDSVLFVAITAYCFTAPFTKVEESFNIQAVHDILAHGKHIQLYDHQEFPGAVPRTFVGALALAVLTKPLHLLLQDDPTGFDLQLMVRGLLGVLNFFGLLYFKQTVVGALDQQEAAADTGKRSSSRRTRGWADVGLWFTILTASQFHIIYYSSRTLPNFFALPLVNIALASVVKSDYAGAVVLLAFTTVVFRIELVLLMLSVGFVAFIGRKVSLATLVKSALLGGAVGCALSLAIDSFFWGKLTIPELESFIFNVIHGESAKWGVEPFYYYFTKYLFTIFVPPMVILLQFLGGFLNPLKNDSLRILGLASFLYIVLISFQPHKEWRFIVYIIPVFTMNASLGAGFIVSKINLNNFYRVLSIIIIASTVLSTLFSVLWLHVSSLNYPGGEALLILNNIITEKESALAGADYNKNKNITVHLDVAACMTGVTHFGELKKDVVGLNVIYDKTENATELAGLWPSFDYVISEYNLNTNQLIPQSSKDLPPVKGKQWQKIAAIKAFKGLNRDLLLQIADQEFWVSISELITKTNSLAPLANLFDSLIVQDYKMFIYESVPSLQ